MKESLRMLRYRADLSQAELAKLANVTQASITRYEADGDSFHRASFATVESIAQALGVGTDDIDFKRKEVLSK